ncbi:hypothetical protein SDC9_77095 [bioreactor metagenome]|uniref:Uncharacterized protein n=1 Tax=bioreactor metagenome TaxID=1076179 RepID=A0A644YPM3_9ZZZZ
MLSLEELKGKAKDVAQTGVARVLDTGRIAKLSLSNATEAEGLKKVYMEIGRLYYEQHGLCPDSRFESLCDKVTETKARVVANKALITEIKINGVVDDEVCEPEEALG